MDKTMTTIAAIITAIIGLAIVAVLVSSNASTATLISNSGTALSSVIASAVSPVTGGNNAGITNTSSLLNSATSLL